MVLSTTQQALAQNWSTKVVLPNYTCTNTVAGLTASGDRLILTWSSGFADTNGVFNSMISFDGVNWSNRVTRSDFPRIAYWQHGGLGMTYSSACGYVYAGWRDGSNNMWATRSVDGINWETPRLIVSGTALSGPALRGDNGALPIGFAFSSTSSVWPGNFEPFKGKFDCDFSNVVFPMQVSFFRNSTSTYTQQKEPLMPAWVGNGGTTELSALSTGPLTTADPFANMFYKLNDDSERPVSFSTNFWSNNGVAGIVNPNNGAPYIIWTCHPAAGDTCKPESSGRINIFNINTGGQLVFADWSRVNPGVTFFQGKIWIAWQGSGLGCGYINVASLDPF